MGGINATTTIMQKTLLLAAMLMAAAHLVCIQAKGNDLHSDAAVTAYRQKYASVIRHYSHSAADSLKLKAALFLIDNMDGHTMPKGGAMEHYTAALRSHDGGMGHKELQMQWARSQYEGEVVYAPDSLVIDDDFLIENIDDAFDAWQGNAWHDGMTFGHFCRYILPNRANGEYLSRNWRKYFRSRYGEVAKEHADVRKAFAAVLDTLQKDVVLSNPYCPYDLDPVTCHHAGRGECSQRCITFVAAMRALGIPAVIDATPMWADYSQRGHAWVALVMSNDDTYTVYEQDKEAKMHNPIDASQFLPQYTVRDEDRCPYDVKTAKTPIKVYRMRYDHCNSAAKTDPDFLSCAYMADVSGSYGLAAELNFKTAETSPVYLCAYKSAVDWTPVAKAIPENGTVTFRSVGAGSVCVLAVIGEGKPRYISCPLLINKKGVEREIRPSAAEKTTITIDRKYPLCSYTTDAWGYMRGGVFEGSNTADFNHPDTLAEITTMPYGMTILPVINRKAYRYLRYKAAPHSHCSLAELQFYSADEAGNNRMLHGEPFADGAMQNQLPQLFDGNPATICRATEDGYSIGIDLGEKVAKAITEVRFAPSTDLNFVEKGHLYELYYFDTDWHLLKRVYSQGTSLTFHDVPKNALLLLKDRTGGREERIFTYENGKVRWW